MLPTSQPASNLSLKKFFSTFNVHCFKQEKALCPKEHTWQVSALKKFVRVLDFLIIDGGGHTESTRLWLFGFGPKALFCRLTHRSESGPGDSRQRFLLQELQLLSAGPP